jgi:hypothetical protein
MRTDNQAVPGELDAPLYLTIDVEVFATGKLPFNDHRLPDMGKLSLRRLHDFGLLGHT